MPRLSKDQWEFVRAGREAGASFHELSSKFNVAKSAIHRRAKQEGWGDGSDVAEVIRRKVDAKLNNIVNDDPAKKAASIEAAADRSAEVIRRHQTETNAVRERLYAGLSAHKEARTRDQKILAFEDLKAAKISSETIINLHRAERQAHGLDAGESGPTVVIERAYGRQG